MTRIIGYIIFGFSMICWGLLAVVPFGGFSAGRLAAISTGLIIAGEITFYLSIFLIGKEFLVKLKNRLRFRKNKVIDQDSPQ